MKEEGESYLLSKVQDLSRECPPGHGLCLTSAREENEGDVRVAHRMNRTSIEQKQV